MLCVLSTLHACRMAEAQAHASLGYIYELLRDTDKAIDHYEQRLRIALDVIDKGAEARSYCSIGNCLRAMVQPEKALECYSRVSVQSLPTVMCPHLSPPLSSQSLMLATELEDRVGEGVVHANMATTYEMLYNLEETLNHQEKVCLLLHQLQSSVYSQS